MHQIEKTKMQIKNIEEGEKPMFFSRSDIEEGLMLLLYNILYYIIFF